MNHQAGARPFLQQARLALARSGFAPPEAGEARVVLFDSAPWAALCADAENLLDSREHERARRFRHARDRDTYVLAHACWRVALGLTLATDAANVPLVSSESGQPQLPDTGYATSLSHSDSHVAIAIAKANAVGVDIERSPPRNALHDLIDVLCAPVEAAALETLPIAARTPALLALWTRKEALLKAFGIGLRETPASIVADVERSIEPPASAPDAPACRVYQLDLPTPWVGALATSLAITRHSLHWLDLSGCGERSSNAIA